VPDWTPDSGNPHTDSVSDGTGQTAITLSDDFEYIKIRLHITSATGRGLFELNRINNNVMSAGYNTLDGSSVSGQTSIPLLKINGIDGVSEYYGVFQMTGKFQDDRGGVWKLPASVTQHDASLVNGGSDIFDDLLNNEFVNEIEFDGPDNYDLEAFVYGVNL